MEPKETVMRRSFVALLLFPYPLAAAEPSLKEARTRWLKGNYAEAAAAFEELCKEEKPVAAAVMGLSRVLQSQGEYDKALEVVEKGLAKRDGDTDLLARKAEL